MKVEIVGGGPSGLYLAILLAKTGDHQIRVRERNPPDATFGWGVVFSEETLGSLRDADNPSYVEITDTFARWDRVDVRYRDRVIRARGNAFSAIARKRLLQILQRRCYELGVALEFGQEVPDPGAIDADLVVGADGVFSTARRGREKVLGTRISPQGCTYAWFGTDLVFDAFTFIFRETEDGLFQVHAYPFDEHLSTFIVECPEDTWRRAGLDRMDEQQSIAFCEALFADDLDGHRLLSNRSLWTRFQLVRNETWHDGRVVLLGDAAHTAHFSIGSGTKLAMEDSIALANALARHGGDVERALVDYELERQPVVERLQQAAGDSAAYFERVSRTTHLEPVQFAFNLLTRSGRVGHANMTMRDPGLMRAVDSWFARRAGVATSIAPPPAFTPLRLGALELPNRIVSRGGADGAGLVLTEFVAVSEEGRITPATPCRIEDRAPGVAVGLQVGHAGRRGATRDRAAGVDLPLREGWPLVSASPIPYAPLGATPEELDEEGMARIRDDFVAAAEGAAGVDLLELNFAQGYVMHSFLSPLSNRRRDEYGSDRLRYPLEVLTAVRDAWPGVLAVRFPITDWAKKGIAPDEGIAIARALAEGGADLLHPSAGQAVAEGSPEYRRGFLTTLCARVRTEVGVPVLASGYLTTLDEANTMLAAGRADLCLLELTPHELERDDDDAATPAEAAVA